MHSCIWDVCVWNVYLGAMYDMHAYVCGVCVDGVCMDWVCVYVCVWVCRGVYCMSECMHTCVYACMCYHTGVCPCVWVLSLSTLFPEVGSPPVSPGNPAISARASPSPSAGPQTRVCLSCGFQVLVLPSRLSSHLSCLPR